MCVCMCLYISWMCVCVCVFIPSTGATLTRNEDKVIYRRPKNTRKYIKKNKTKTDCTGYGEEQAGGNQRCAREVGENTTTLHHRTWFTVHVSVCTWEPWHMCGVRKTAHGSPLSFHHGGPRNQAQAARPHQLGHVAGPRHFWSFKVRTEFVPRIGKKTAASFCEQDLTTQTIKD